MSPKNVSESHTIYNPLDYPEGREQILHNSDFLLEQRCLQIIENNYNGEKTILVIDFDNCAAGKVSPEVTSLINIITQGPIKPDVNGSRKEMLNQCYNYPGLPLSSFSECVSTAAIHNPVKNDFCEFRKEIRKNKDVFLFIVSAGLQRGALVALQHKGIHDIPVIGTEISFSTPNSHSSKLGPPTLVIGAQQKAEVIQIFKKYGNIENVITVGDGPTDAKMSKLADLSICMGNDPILTKICDKTVNNWSKASAVISPYTFQSLTLEEWED
jgi:phosphoserine phosphatase